jgi:hypothetical protein
MSKKKPLKIIMHQSYARKSNRLTTITEASMSWKMKGDKFFSKQLEHLVAEAR